MKRYFVLLILCLVLFSCSVSKNYPKILDFEGKNQKLEKSKPTVYVLFSTLGCHECHIKLNEFFEKNDLYSNDKINIVGYIGLEKGNIKEKISRKSALIAFNRYYPKIKETVFVEKSKEKDIFFLDHKIPDYEVPAIVLLKKDTILFLEVRDVFKYENRSNYDVDKDLLILIERFKME